MPLGLEHKEYGYVKPERVRNNKPYEPSHGGNEKWHELTRLDREWKEARGIQTPDRKTPIGLNKGEQAWHRKYGDTKVYQYSLEGELLKIYANVSQAAKAMGIEHTAIRRVVQGKRKSAAGFYWERK
jgi:hypothetical protein